MGLYGRARVVWHCGTQPIQLIRALLLGCPSFFFSVSLRSDKCRASREDICPRFCLKDVVREKVCP